MVYLRYHLLTELVYDPQLDISINTMGLMTHYVYDDVPMRLMTLPCV